MIQSTFHAVSQPDAGVTDPLYELLRQRVRDLIAKARLEAELSTFLEQYTDPTHDSRRFCNGIPLRMLFDALSHCHDAVGQVAKVLGEAGHHHMDIVSQAALGILQPARQCCT